MRFSAVLAVGSAALVAGVPSAFAADDAAAGGLLAGAPSLVSRADGFRAGSLFSADQPGVRFGIALKSLAAEGVENDPAVSRRWQVYGSSRELALPTVSLPGYDLPVRRSNMLGLSWQHHVDARDEVAVSAEHGSNVTPNLFGQDTLESRAVLSWTHRWGASARPSFTGSVFMGDQVAKEESFRQLGRRYMGFSVGGQVTLAKTHVPYVSYQLRRSYYDADNGGTLGAPRPFAAFEDWLLSSRYDERSQITAGYRWQASPYVSLQAEASYGLNNDGQDLYNPERARLFFGTRFDFR